MASSDFWRDIADKFRNIPEGSTLTVEWNNPRHLESGEWSVAGSTTAILSFEALARRVAREISDPSTPDLYKAWLEQLCWSQFSRTWIRRDNSWRM